ncbi:lipopolysaccharide heptosyltransferase II [Holophaga foetida]|uniref:lipopolysaccharide heptosyltransferase II n=1 Tax=Holophaga foetida TaxID=35839 RepID=UPI00024736FD|nr:lipopolysaccharide heptosyltransferase II [Holophaga foetida]
MALRIFIRSLNWLGDTVFQAPALRLLRLRHPDAEIFIQARPSVADVVRAYGIGEVLPWADGILARARQIREIKADQAILLPKSLGTGVEAFLGRVPERLGWGEQGRNLLLTRVLPRWSDQDHYALRIRKLMIDALELSGELPATGAELELPVAWAEAAEDALPGNFGPFLLIAPGASGGTAKQWPPAQWKALLECFTAHGLRSVVVGTTREAELGAFLAGGNPGVLDLVGRTDLRALGGLAARASLVLANDSGLVHLAGALGAPVLALYGPTDPATSHPLGVRAHALWNRVACAPCHKRQCPTDHRCMLGLLPGDVLSAALALLGEGGSRSPLLVTRPSLPGIL